MNRRLMLRTHVWFTHEGAMLTRPFGVIVTCCIDHVILYIRPTANIVLQS